jgi:hypothetical protein
MKSFSILAGLIGLASASNWNETWTHAPSSSASRSESTLASSSSSSVPEHLPTGWVKPTGWTESSSAPEHKPTGWTESSSVASSSVEHNATSTLVTYLTTTICPTTYLTTSAGKTYTQTTTLTSVLTVTSCKGGCSKPTQAPSSTWVPSSSKPAANVTSTETVYTTTSLCPITTVKQGHTFTYTTTSTFVVTSCKGGCSKPTQSAPATTKTEEVYYTTTICPITETTVSAGKTLTKTYTTTSTIAVTSCKGGCSKSTEAPKQSSQSVPSAPYPIHNATTQGHAGPSGFVPSGSVPVVKTKTLTASVLTTVTVCTSGQVITTGGVKTTLTAPSTITSFFTSYATITAPTQGHVVPTVPVYSNGTTKYVTDVTTTYLTTCPVSSTYVTGGVTKTTTYQTVSTATSVIKVSKTGSVQTPATSAPEVSKSSGKVTIVVPVTEYTTTCPYTTVDQHGSTSVFMTTSVVSHPAESTKVSSAPVESHPASSPVAPVQSSKSVETHPASSPATSVESHPASSPVVPVQSTKPVESHPASSPVAPVSSPVAPVQSSKSVESHPASSPATSVETHPASSPAASVETHPASSPVAPVQSTKPVESAPATTPAASSPASSKPTGNVVTQISDGQIQAPGPSSAPPAIPVSSGSVATSVRSVLSSSVHANAPSSTSGTVASATTSTPAQYTGAASKSNASFMAAVAAMAAVFFF